ncbi:hypothetical protein ACPW96_13680 [Micromonospora sp. DT81.3]|uniref:hypothetical protein n=1 Tax=Micromonospora sp. DT81.3 TaxID=3416523 RepID=UPI003CF3094E
MVTPATAWSPPLPGAPGFDHVVIETPGLRTHLAVIAAHFITDDAPAAVADLSLGWFERAA